MSSLLTGVQSLHTTSAYSSVDLSPLFRALASESQRSADRGRSLRLILFYCRSSCIPGPPPNRAPHPAIPFTADCIYWHDRPNNFNCPQEVFDGLTAALEAVSVPEPYIWENSSNSVRYIFRVTSSLLAHPAQRLADDYLSMPRVLDSGPRNTSPGEGTASGVPGSGASGSGLTGSGAPNTGYYSGGAGGLDAVYGGNGGEKGERGDRGGKGEMGEKGERGEKERDSKGTLKATLEVIGRVVRYGAGWERGRKMLNVTCSDVDF
ncbi:unnamed protein product [Closterium sp. NIES-54]